MINKIPESFRIGSCIKYSYLYLNDTDSIGVILKIKEDANFTCMVTILTELSKIEIIPYNVMEYNIL